MQLTLMPICDGEPFVPTHWLRLVEVNDRGYYIVDNQIHLPNAELVGIKFAVDRYRVATRDYDPYLYPQSFVLDIGHGPSVNVGYIGMSMHHVSHQSAHSNWYKYWEVNARMLLDSMGTECRWPSSCSKRVLSSSQPTGVVLE